MEIIWTASLIIFILLLLYQYLRNVYSYWHKRGLKGPKPIPFIGNLLPIFFGNRMQLEKDWARKYGKVYGIYTGLSPRLVVADPDVLQQICIKNFDSFVNRENRVLGNKYEKLFLIALQGDQWRKVRAILSPTFTSGKIKRMFKFLNGCSEDLIQCFKEQLNAKKINVRDTYSLFAMDSITTCCYGLKLERQGSLDLKSAASRDDFVRLALKLVNFDNFRLVISIILPHRLLALFKFNTANIKRFEPLAVRVRQLIENRRKLSSNGAKKFDDYLQLLLDSKLDDEMELGEMDLEENHHAGLSKESLLDDQKKMVSRLTKSGEQKCLNEQEILASAMFLLTVGLETTSTLLTSTTYILAFHQEIQHKLYEELKKIAIFDEGTKGYSFDYEPLTSCKYLDAVICEALRLWSPALALDRDVGEDVLIEKYNIKLPKGHQVFLAYHAVMNDPDYWDEPEKFNPERFMPGNKEKIKPGSYCPFGLGPRHCIGMRFSLTESKLALAKVIMNFQFYPAPGTVFPPEPRIKVFLNGVKDPLVRIQAREF